MGEVSAMQALYGSEDAWKELTPAYICDSILAKLDQVESLDVLAQPPLDGQPYGRAILYKDERIEVMLASWRKGAVCAPHDHGVSLGCVKFARGRFIETQFEFNSD